MLLEEFIRNLLLVDDLVEQGIHLASDYNNRVHSKERIVVLFQVVEDFRIKVNGIAKASLRMWRPV